MEKKLKKHTEDYYFFPDDLFMGWGSFLSFVGDFYSLYFAGEYKLNIGTPKKDRKKLMEEIDNIIRSFRK